MKQLVGDSSPDEEEPEVQKEAAAPKPGAVIKILKKDEPSIIEEANVKHETLKKDEPKRSSEKKEHIESEVKPQQLSKKPSQYQPL